MRHEVFASCMKALEKSYPKFSIINDEEKMDVWFEMLKDIEDEDLLTATRAFVGSSKFDPTIAGLREHLPQRGLSPEEAWELVYRDLKGGVFTPGRYQGILRRVATVFQHDIEDLGAQTRGLVRRDFVKYYENMDRNESPSDVMKELTKGIFKQLKEGD